MNVYTTSGKFVHLTHQIGEGGEGQVWLTRDETEVAKIYARPTPQQASKLSHMTANPPYDPLLSTYGFHSLLWPTDLLLNTHGQFIGFLMPRLSDSLPLLDVYNPAMRREKAPGFNYLYLTYTALNLATVVDSIHRHGYVIGDINEKNIFVNPMMGLVSILDTDSFQVTDASGRIYPCPVGRQEFTPPELQNAKFKNVIRTPEHDRFGLAVLLFCLLMEGNHPYQGVMHGENPSELPDHIYCLIKGAFPYAGSRLVSPRPTAPPFEMLSPDLQALFRQAFVDGARYPCRRPTAETWAQALAAAKDELIECSRQQGHFYSRHWRGDCPWCQREAVRQAHRSRPAVSRTAVQMPAPIPVPAPALTHASHPTAPTVSATPASKSWKNGITSFLRHLIGGAGFGAALWAAAFLLILAGIPELTAGAIGFVVGLGSFLGLASVVFLVFLIITLICLGIRSQEPPEPLLVGGGIIALAGVGYAAYLTGISAYQSTLQFIHTNFARIDYPLTLAILTAIGCSCGFAVGTFQSLKAHFSQSPVPAFISLGSAGVLLLGLFLTIDQHGGVAVLLLP